MKFDSNMRYIAISHVWSGRCWTLSEAILARDIFLQFNDGVLNMIEVWDEEFLR
jgi:hypothetical protein